MCKIWWFLLNSERKKKPIHVSIVKKIHGLEITQYAFLDHSKTLVFSDVTKIEILFKYSRARAIRTYSVRSKKKLYRAISNNHIAKTNKRRRGQLLYSQSSSCGMNKLKWASAGDHTIFNLVMRWSRAVVLGAGPTTAQLHPGWDTLYT